MTKQRYQASADLTELRDHPDNPRRGDDGAVASSVDTNGFYGAIIAQVSTKTVLAGHTRRRVLLNGGFKHGPVIWVDCDDDTATRILVGDNRTAELAFWDGEQLLDVLQKLNDGDNGLAGVGFGMDDLAGMIERFGGAPPLDGMAEEYGEPDERVLWPIFRLQIPKAVLDRYLALANRTGMDSDAGRFEQVVAWAEAGTPQT